MGLKWKCQSSVIKIYLMSNFEHISFIFSLYFTLPHYLQWASKADFQWRKVINLHFSLPLFERFLPSCHGCSKFVIQNHMNDRLWLFWIICLSFWLIYTFCILLHFLSLSSFFPIGLKLYILSLSVIVFLNMMKNDSMIIVYDWFLIAYELLLVYPFGCVMKSCYRIENFVSSNTKL